MKRIHIIVLFLLMGIVYAQSKTEHTEIKVGFRVNRIYIDPNFKDNAEQTQKLDSVLNQIAQDSTIEVLGISFRGAASPEGNDKWNRYLAKNRRLTLETIIRNRINPADSIISYNDSYIPWDDYRHQIQQSNLPYKDTVLSIIDEEPRIVDYYPHKGKLIDHRILKLQKLYNGTAWREMFDLYFADLRYSYITISYRKKDPAIFALPILYSGVSIPVAPKPFPQKKETKKDSTEWIPQIHFKTNAIGLGLLMANAAVEVDVAKHWSVNLPIYYSAWNYGKSTIKFRTFSLYPEVKYWFSENNDGLFVGAHLGLAYYNYAFDGAIRYQDYRMKTPAIGGGLGIGYRFPLSKDKRWKLEFAIGAGVYPLYFDLFHNTPNVKDGLLIESQKKIYFGIDQAEITFSYALDLKKNKGGAK